MAIDLPANARPSVSARTRTAETSSLADVLKSLASLKLAVTLFGLSIFLILAGTLAQAEKDIWVVLEQYFRCWFAWIEFRVFVPPAWFPELENRPTGGFWYPGGWLIGGLMTVNLLAAHAIRFRVQARGAQLLAGVVLTGLGIATTFVVIAYGPGTGNSVADSDLDWFSVWGTCKLILAGASVLLALAAMRVSKERKSDFALLFGLCVLTGGAAAWLYGAGDAVRLDNSGIRILWQLIKATVAGVILLAGCWLLFQKRAGIVLLHAGVLLLMSNEILVAVRHVEAQMVLREGQASNIAEDIRTHELVVRLPLPDDQTREVTIPIARVSAALTESPTPAANQRLTHPDLPFDIVPRRLVQNAGLRQPGPGEQGVATIGSHPAFLVDQLAPVSGVDMSGKFDNVTTVVELFEQGSDKSLGTVLCSLVFGSTDKLETISTGDTTCEMGLRFKRFYKDYAIRLLDVRADNYIGTDVVQNYASRIHLYDTARGEDRETTIWMNNPLRFAGDTIYQSKYDRTPTGVESTGLQIVSNEGWMIPYVACMIVAVGMLAQFLLTLSRYLSRWTEGRLPESGSLVPAQDRLPAWQGYLVPAALAIVVCAWMGAKALVPSVDSSKEFDLYRFGQIPVVYEGRVKPLDTVARNALRVLSARETFYAFEEDLVPLPAVPTQDIPPVRDAKLEPGEKVSATRWLLDLMANPRTAFRHRVIRIDNPDLVRELGLDWRKSHLYSLDEFGSEIIAKISPQAKEARQLLQAKAPLSIYQRKILDLEQKIGEIDLLMQSFGIPRIRFDEQNLLADLRQAVMTAKELEARNPPAVIPGTIGSSEPDWQPLSTAWTRNVVESSLNDQPENPFCTRFAEILVAFADNKPAEFNTAVNKFLAEVAEPTVALPGQATVPTEARFNLASPFFYAGLAYLFAFLLTVLGWLTRSRVLERAAFAMIVGIFLYHSGALISRMYISGRPPVTNLYSASVFIGWGAVLFSMVIELLTRKGFGNAVAAMAGFGSLWVAHGLAGDGDTMKVLQAVLDTQFWLSTHVVCVSMGYVATYVAGFLGALYVLAGLFTRGLDGDTAKSIPRMVYGVLCFALFFSFVGTVLGGLWADDSWGRFWGWDPKENGALLIVIWNALILHARWDGMVKERGTAILAVAGNIVTTWSFFGVNELGVGLHSYGFTEGTLPRLAMFVGSQLAIILLATIVPWRSGPGKSTTSPQSIAA